MVAENTPQDIPSLLEGSNMASLLLHIYIYIYIDRKTDNAITFYGTTHPLARTPVPTLDINSSP